MTLKSKLMLFTAAVAFSASMASAAITSDDIVKTYQDAAFSSIQVTEGPTQIKVEAVKNGVKLEVIYDKLTGAVVKRDRNKATRAERSNGGVEVSTETDDFTDGTTSYESNGRKGKETHLGNNDGGHNGNEGRSDHSSNGESASDGNGSNSGNDNHGDSSNDNHSSSDNHSGSDHGNDNASSHDSNDDHSNSDNNSN